MAKTTKQQEQAQVAQQAAKVIIGAIDQAKDRADNARYVADSAYNTSDRAIRKACDVEYALETMQRAETKRKAFWKSVRRVVVCVLIGLAILGLGFALGHDFGFSQGEKVGHDDAIRQVQSFFAQYPGATCTTTKDGVACASTRSIVSGGEIRAIATMETVHF